AAFFEAAVIPCEPAGAAIIIRFVDALGPGPEGVHRETRRIALVDAQRHPVMAVVAVIGIMLNASELRIGFIVLICIANGGQYRTISGDIQRYNIDVPVIEKTHTGRTLIENFCEPTAGYLVLYTARPVQRVRHTHIGIEPRGGAAAI